MRFLCAFKVKEKDSVILKTRVFTVKKISDVDQAKYILLKWLVKRYKFDTNAPFIDREEDKPGIMYINYKQKHHIDGLLDINSKVYEEYE